MDSRNQTGLRGLSLPRQNPPKAKVQLRQGQNSLRGESAFLETFARIVAVPERFTATDPKPALTMAQLKPTNLTLATRKVFPASSTSHPPKPLLQPIAMKGLFGPGPVVDATLSAGLLRMVPIQSSRVCVGPSSMSERAEAALILDVLLPFLHYSPANEPGNPKGVPKMLFPLKTMAIWVC